MTCAFCGSTARPSLAMGSDMQLREACAECGKPLDSSAPDPLLTETVVATTVGKPRNDVDQPADILTLAKSRLAQIERELSALEAKRNEAAMLRRMIAAAEPPN